MAWVNMKIKLSETSKDMNSVTLNNCTCYFACTAIIGSSCSGICGARYDRDQACQCNRACPRYGNCCPDVGDVCDFPGRTQGVGVISLVKTLLLCPSC